MFLILFIVKRTIYKISSNNFFWLNTIKPVHVKKKNTTRLETKLNINSQPNSSLKYADRYSLDVIVGYSSVVTLLQNWLIFTTLFCGDVL